jgi:hypothetical protein
MRRRVALLDRRWRRVRDVAALFAAALMASGCSSGLGSSESPLGGGMFNLFSGGGGSGSGGPNSGGPQFDDNNCPVVDVRVGASTLSLTTPKAQQATANDVRYQLSFNRLARQCIAAGGALTVKLGVQGRVVVGPAGGPGPVNVPLRYAVVQEGIAPKTIATKFKRLSVNVPAEEGNVAFEDVDDSLTFAIPPLEDLQYYVIYVGFDAAGDTPEKKPPAKKAAAQRKK